MHVRHAGPNLTPRSLTEGFNVERKLVTIRTIDAIDPIDGADAIETAVIGGWKIVVKKGDFNPGDRAVYFEIDSFLPDGNPAWQFLVDKQPKIFNEVKGHRLRTIKLRGQISQGLVLPLDALPEVKEDVEENIVHHQRAMQSGSTDLVACDSTLDEYLSYHDYSLMLGVVKWEILPNAQLGGQTKGTFPSFIPKTDEERCQNIVPYILGYEPTIVPAWGDRPEYERAPKAFRGDQYEVSLKLDGSSMTAYYNLYEGVPGVCSRNQELKLDDEGNTFVATFNKLNLGQALIDYNNETGDAIALQGELMGPGVQGNRENFIAHRFYLFNIYNITAARKLLPDERHEVSNRLNQLGSCHMHVPVLFTSTLPELGIHNVEDLLKFAEKPSIHHPVAEGFVFKRMHDDFSFKVISNTYLIKEK